MSSKNTTAVAIIVFSVIGIACLVIPLGIYHNTFGDSKISPDPASWGQFGDYVGGILNPILGLLNLVVIVYLATVVRSIQKGEETEAKALQTACEMHKEWSSEKMYRSREAAFRFLKKYPNANLKELEERERNREPDLQHVWVVVGFFERIDTMLTFSVIRDDHFIAIFARIFVWWDRFCFQGQLPAVWPAHERVASLRVKVRQKVPERSIQEWEDYADTYKTAKIPSDEAFDNTTSA